MSLIYETQNFIVEAPDRPHIDRNDGGHIRIYPKIKVVNIQELSPKLAIELTRLVSIVGEAMMIVMNNHGVDIARINYQDNGNWSVFNPEGPYLHIHLYGRAKSAITQKFGQSLNFPHIEEHPEFYKNFRSLTVEDTSGLKIEIEKLLAEEKYSDSNWGLDNL